MEVYYDNSVSTRKSRVLTLNLFYLKKIYKEEPKHETYPVS